LAAKIRAAKPEAEITLIPGGRGDFIVRVDGGKPIWDKRRMGDEFPDEAELVDDLP
jgi:predicted Rdx family selenoprotein